MSTAIRDALAALDARGISAAGGRARARRSCPRRRHSPARPRLVRATAPGLHTRNTRQVYDELIGAAVRSIWISTFAYFDGQHAFSRSPTA